MGMSTRPIHFFVMNALHEMYLVVKYMYIMQPRNGVNNIVYKMENDHWAIPADHIPKNPGANAQWAHNELTNNVNIEIERKQRCCSENQSIYI